MFSHPIAHLLIASLLIIMLQRTAAAEISTVPRQPMPDAAGLLLRQAVDDFQSKSPYYPESKGIAQKTVERWCKTPWPDLKDLQRVHVDMPEARKKDTRIYFRDRCEYNAWQLKDGRLLLDDFTERAVRPYETLKPVDYPAELREMAAYSELYIKAKTQAEYTAMKTFEFHHMAAAHRANRLTSANRTANNPLRNRFAR